ncbi:MAG: efflux RND transporter periplasmic adaptor subunit [Ketobacter sp.]|nr:MAG: efflux RND transporter periplasmic adaptor subunit [Ketobacter sp.]
MSLSRVCLHQIVVALVLLSGATASYSQSEAVPVSVVSPTQTVPTNRLRLSGNLVAVQQANLSARVDGLVGQVKVDAGDRVRKGDVLLDLDDALEKHELARLQAATSAAEAQVKEDRRLVDEAQRLTSNNSLPKNELYLRQAALDANLALLAAAKAEQAAQQQRVEWHHLTAPFDGVIYRKLTENGEWVTRGTPVLELVATDRLYLDVQVPQERFGTLSPDTEVNVLPDAIPGQTLKAKVVALVPVGEAGSRTFRVRLVMENSDNQLAGLLPGFSANAVFNLSQGNKTALMVPRDALLRDPDGSFSLMTVTDSDGQTLAKRVKVKLGYQSGTQVEILEGLVADAKVVTRGNEILRHDQLVKIVKDK